MIPLSMAAAMYTSCMSQRVLLCSPDRDILLLILLRMLARLVCTFVCWRALFTSSAINSRVTLLLRLAPSRINFLVFSCFSPHEAHVSVSLYTDRNWFHSFHVTRFLCSDIEHGDEAATVELLWLIFLNFCVHSPSELSRCFFRWPINLKLLLFATRGRRLPPQRRSSEATDFELVSREGADAEDQHARVAAVQVRDVTN